MSRKILLTSLLAILIVGCARSTATPKPTQAVSSPTPEPSAPVEPALTSATQTATTSPTPTQENPATPFPQASTLTICLIAEPVSLYYYDGPEDLWLDYILEAIYDGPIDYLSSGYQAVILEKLPSLADGDATLQAVTVREGDQVVNDNGEVVPLAIGEVIRPFGCIQPDCAVIWDGHSIEMAQLSATFKLLEGIKWSDGEPLTSGDSVFSFNVAQKCKSKYSNEGAPCGFLGRGLETLQRTASYTALDELTTQWVGLPGYLDAYYQTNFAHPLPAHVLSNYPPDTLFERPEAATNPMGWGPYMIQKYERGQYVKLIRNPYYFRANQGLPEFDELTFLFVAEKPRLGIDMLLSGECDILESSFFRNGRAEELFEQEPKGEVKTIVEVRDVWDGAAFNIRPDETIKNTGAFAGWDLDGDGLGPFGDVRLRQAIALCMDRQAVVDQLFYGRSQWFDTFLPPSHPLYHPPVPGYSHNITTAGWLLDEIGWLDLDQDPQTPRTAQGITGVPDGTLLEFSYETGPWDLQQQASQILAESMSLCGIKVDLIHHLPGIMYADGPDGRLFGRRFDMAQISHFAFNASDCQNWQSVNIPGDPQILDERGNPLYPRGWQTYAFGVYVNETGYQNNAFDAACYLAASSLPGQPEYANYANEVQTIFASDLPVVPLYLPIVNVAATRPDLCGYMMDPTANEMWNIESFTLEPGCK